MSYIDSLNYPFDSNYILKHSKSIKKELLEFDSFKNIKIAILSGSTIGYVKNILELFLLNNGLKPEFYEGEYNRFYENALFDNSLIEFNPDIVFIHTSGKNIKNWDNSDSEFNYFKEIWQKLLIHNFKIIQNNFEMSDYRVLGNRDIYDKSGRLNFIHTMNSKMYEYAQSNAGFYINDINYLSASIGLEKWHNQEHWAMYKYMCDVSCIPDYCFSVSNIIKSLYGKNKKTIMLDLDNTLWGGIIGDIGEDKIEIGMETPMGEMYLYFQQYLKELSKNGVILNIVSKNDEKIALKGLNSDKNCLKSEDFISKRINWLPKSENIKTILKEINLLPESAVFVDDSLIEQDEVRQNLPQVEVLKALSIENFKNYLDKSGFFECTILSDDDKKRVEYYKANQKRKEEETKFADYNEYLKSLNMTACISGLNDKNTERVVQLFNKTNQFNLTQKKYSVTDVGMLNAENSIAFSVELDDKFGKNGIISAFVGLIDNDNLIIDNWVMSCRVFKRNLENAIFAYLIRKCKNLNIKNIIGVYSKTTKNAYIENLFTDLGFEQTEEIENISKYKFVIQDFYEQDIIKITGEENG